MNEACATFTDIRPVTYAYGVMVSDLRIGNPRPRILKLHGDYLYSRLKNSKDELQFQDANMSRSVPLLLNEYGLIVIGYSGCDESVMDLLRQLAPGNDLYWCGLPTKDDALAPSVRRLLDKTGGAYVEIESFDKMMSEVRSIVGFDIAEDVQGGRSARRCRHQSAEADCTHLRCPVGFDKMAREICALPANRYWRRGNRSVRSMKRWSTMPIRSLRGEERVCARRVRGRESLRLDPTDYETQAWLAQVLAQQGQHRDALDLLEQARRTASWIGPANIMFAMGIHRDGWTRRRVDRCACEGHSPGHRSATNRPCDCN